MTGGTANITASTTMTAGPVTQSFSCFMGRILYLNDKDQAVNEAQQQVVDSTVDATLAAIGGKTTWAGAGAAVFGWATSSGFGVLVGAFGVICGLLMQWYFNRRRDRREEAAERRAQAEHDKRMAQK